MPRSGLKKGGGVDIIPPRAFERLVGGDLHQELTPLAQDLVNRAREYVDSIPGFEAVDDSPAMLILHQDPHVTPDAPVGLAAWVAMTDRYGYRGEVGHFPARTPREIEDDDRDLASGTAAGPNSIHSRLFCILIDLMHEDPDDAPLFELLVLQDCIEWNEQMCKQVFLLKVSGVPTEHGSITARFFQSRYRCRNTLGCRGRGCRCSRGRWHRKGTCQRRDRLSGGLDRMERGQLWRKDDCQTRRPTSCGCSHRNWKSKR